MPGQHPDGISLVPILTGKDPRSETAHASEGTRIEPRPLFWHYPHYSNQGGKPGAAIRLGNLKLIEFFENHTVELYDLSADPGEQQDLSAAMPYEVERLLMMLHAWQEEVDAGGMAPNPAWDPQYQRKNYVK